jgi:ATP-dependent helicase/nuclease subunit A
MEHPSTGANHLMILASAGSGKTYQLVNRVITLVAQGADPAQIVALTFTRKAAGEFADAVLTRLADAVVDDEVAARLRTEIGVADAEFTPLLENVVRSLPRFQLGTIDGFFARIVKAFQYDLGLTGGAFALVEGPRARLLTDRLLGIALTGGAQPDLDAEFMETFRRATMGREDVEVLRPLRMYVDHWHEKYLENPTLEWGPSAWASLDPAVWETEKHTWAERVRAGLDAVDYTDKRQSIAMHKLVDSIAQHTIGSGALGNQHMGALFERLIDDVAADAQGPMELRLYKPFQLPSATADPLRKMLQRCARCELAAAARRTRATHRVIDAYDALAARHLRGQGLLGFRDVKHLMGLWAQNEDARLRRELVDFRLDARFRHWLLDEFQDTSGADWKGLSTLVEEVVSSEDGTLFIVGDKKQAIYGWRGGDVSLFDSIYQRYSAQMELRPMADSYRSCPEVLALVNRVCGDSGTLRRLFGSAAQRWPWEDHVSAPHLRRPDKAGEARVESLDGWDKRQQRTLEILTTLGVGTREMTCGVLLRDNEKARQMADFLRSHGFDVVFDGARKPATDSPVGWLILQTLRWLANPADSLAYEVLSMSPAGQALHEAHGGSWHDAWAELAERVSRCGFSGALRDWLAPCASGWSEFGRGRWQDLLKALETVDQQGIVTAREAAEWLEQIEIAQAPGAAEVQVMTIHKSKGLGFDAVILPEVPDQKVPESRHFEIADHPEEGWILNTPPRWARELLPELAAAEDRWSEQQCYEAMCLLYVALTRAKRGLYVLMDTPSDQAKEDHSSLAHWLRHSLGAGTEDVLFQAGSPGWSDHLPLLRPEPPPAAEPSLGLAVPRRGKFNPSARGSDHRTYAATQTKGIDFGNEVHRVLERVRWIDETPPSLPNTDAGRAVSALLAEPTLAPLFQRAGRNVDLLIEQPVDAILEKKYLTGTIDRLLLHREAGAVTQVEIIDWKTDATPDAEDLTTRHTPQLQAYRSILERAFPHALIRCLLVSVKHRRALEV